MRHFMGLVIHRVVKRHNVKAWPSIAEAWAICARYGYFMGHHQVIWRHGQVIGSIAKMMEAWPKILKACSTVQYHKILNHIDMKAWPSYRGMAKLWRHGQVIDSWRMDISGGTAKCVWVVILEGMGTVLRRGQKKYDYVLYVLTKQWPIT